MTTLLLAAALAAATPRVPVVLYESTQPSGSSYNAGAAPTPDPVRTVFDDVAIPVSRLEGLRHANIRQLDVGIQRRAGAPATDVYVMGAYLTSRPVSPDTELVSSQAIPLCGFSLAAATQDELVVLSCGNGGTSLSSLFATPLDFELVPGAGAFAVGVQFSSTDPRNGWATTSGPDTGVDSAFRLDPLHSGQSETEARFDFGGAPPAHFYVRASGYPARFVEGDFNDDGVADLVVRTTVSGATQVQWMSGETCTWRQWLQWDGFTGGDSGWRVAGVNLFFGVNTITTMPSDVLLLGGDGGAPRTGGEIKIGYGASYAGPLSVGPPLDLSSFPYHEPAATGDFDHDGFADVVLQATRPGEVHDIIIVRNAWPGPWPAGTHYTVPGGAVDSNWSVAGARDFDLDGNRDLLFFNQTSGRLVIWYLDERRTRMRGAFTNPAQVANNNWRVVATGDFGPGPGGVANAIDLVWRNVDSGRTVFWFMDANPLGAVRTSGAFYVASGLGCGILSGSMVVGPR